MLGVEKVKEIMRTEKINISQLAKKIGISPQHLSNILGGSRGLSTETLKALAQALNVDVVDILDDSSNGESRSAISIEKGEGFVIEKTSRFRIVLPPNSESSELIRQLITESEELNDKIQKLLVSADRETKEKILSILENR